MTAGRRRIGLTQRVEDHAARRERRDALDQRWASFLARGGWVAIPIPNSLEDPTRFVDDLAIDLVVFTGGNDLATLPEPTDTAPERDATERALLAHLTATRRPLLGVCRGLQHMVAVAGGQLRRAVGHVGVPHEITVVGSPRWPVRQGVVNSFHDWTVSPGEVGADYEVLAQATDGSVEALADRELPHVGVMWHPERPIEDSADLELIAASWARSDARNHLGGRGRHPAPPAHR